MSAFEIGYIILGALTFAFLFFNFILLLSEHINFQHNFKNMLTICGGMLLIVALSAAWPLVFVLLMCTFELE